MNESKLKNKPSRQADTLEIFDGEEMFFQYRFRVNIEKDEKTLEEERYQRAIRTLLFLCPELRDKELGSVSPESVN